MIAKDHRPLAAPLDTDKPCLVLLHGWGYDRHCWPEKMLQQLRLNHQLILLDLPGHGQDGYEITWDQSIEQLDEWINTTKQSLPQSYYLMGWSLGAQIAIRMAHNDRRIKGLMLMAFNPKFTISAAWPAAMAEELLLSFQQSYETSAGKTLSRFASLQAQGSTKPKLLAAHMITLMAVKSEKIGGLKLLQLLDERAHLQQLSQPCCIELAKDDELAPSAWVEHLVLPKHIKIKWVAGGHGFLLDAEATHTVGFSLLQLRASQ